MQAEGRNPGFMGGTWITLRTLRSIQATGATGATLSDRVVVGAPNPIYRTGTGQYIGYHSL